MKTLVVLPLLVALCLSLAAAPATAQTDLYDNGLSTLGTDAWTINSGFAVTDSFVLVANGTATAASFIFWLFPGDKVSSLDLSIGTSAFGNDVANFTDLPRTGDSDVGTNEYGFDLRTETFSFNPVSLDAGTTYWITLKNATANNGDPVYWDESGGPSQAQQSTTGTIPSESFTILGNGSTSGGTTPEPASIMLFGSAILTAAGVLCRRRRL